MVDLEKAKIDPSSVFKSPEEVVHDQTLTHDQKIDILQRWAYDEREMEVAEEENMLGSHTDENHTLDEILNSLLELGVEGDQKDPPPTKQG